IILLGLIYNGLMEGKFIESLLGMGAYSLPFIFVYGYFSRIFKKETLGFGDVKLSLGVGAVLTFTTFEKVYWFFSLSFILGGIYCTLFWIYKNILNEKVEENIPFAPFISLALIILMVYYKG
ncbi:MAG: prepilin peptidase, partial [Fusobacteriaceae bacterium]